MSARPDHQRAKHDGDSARRLLGDITEAQHNQANVRMQQSGKPQQARDGADATYFQQQYHSAVMQDAVNLHSQYMQMQEQGFTNEAFMLQQQLLEQQHHSEASAGLTPQRRQGKSASAMQRPRQQQPQRRVSPITASYHHSDDASNPCDCPDCNMRRLQEVMAESCAPSAQAQSTGAQGRFAEQMDFDPMHFDTPQRRGSVPSMSPVEAHWHHVPHYLSAPDPMSYASAFTYDVPYIPARTYNSRHFVVDAEMQDESPYQVADATRDKPQDETPTVSPNAGARRGAPKPPPKPVAQKRYSPTLGSPISPFGGSPTTLAPPVPQFELPAANTAAQLPRSVPRRVSPKSGLPHIPAGLARSPCNVVLQVKVSPWHTKVAIASSEIIPVGVHIIFEGDRGHDIGCVVQSTLVSPNETNTLPRFISVATPEEVDTAHKLAAEAAAAVPAAQLAVERAGLRLQLVGAVYQFNREKLTFLYEHCERVDFRQLVRDLYGVFRCRIWMEPVPGCAAHSTPNPAAAHHSARKARTVSPM